ncbi:MAG TPA: hypothetical protein VE404_04540 [Verrucomicrobiae bacterium]|nr:hypothetical protein [Verrucomicrobiae bacterium]
MRKSVLTSAALTFALVTAARADAPASAEAFTRLRALAGDWEGTSEWSGGRTGSGRMNARYYLTGNGTALVEDLTVSGEPIMTSVYHQDGEDLRVTHYCAAGNQPRLKAKTIDLAHGAISFTLVDVTNLRSPDAGHVEALDLRLVDGDHVNVVFTFVGGDKRSVETITLKRVKAGAGAG